ncbi:MAG: NAD(P)/FAD-dependent oxidoreductase [Solirubrobacteraceae bacterium]
MSTVEPHVAVLGGGVVGCACAHALARRGVATILLEAEPGLGLGASGANSGILHTGFDSEPGDLETTLILRSAALREDLMGELGVSVRRCGARLTPTGDEELAAVRELARNATANGVPVVVEPDGSLLVPGESVTDPVVFVHALAGAAQAGGAQVRLRSRVVGLSQRAGGTIEIRLADGERMSVRAAVNCGGLFADEVARLAGEEPFEIYPRKGEFLVFAAPAEQPLAEILLPVPSPLGKGVLVFPTLEGLIVAGPTAREREDKRDWSVEADAEELIAARAQRMYPPLANASPVGAYAGLRPAGVRSNYAIVSSQTIPGLIHVGAIRSTGLSASLGIGEHVATMLAESGPIELGEPRALPTPAIATASRANPWWQRAALHHAAQP